MPLLGNVQMADDYEIIATINNYSGSPLYADSILVYYQLNGGAFQPVLMTQQLGSIYSGTIPYQDEGTVIGYYIHAADESGRSTDHPYIGAPDPHEFTVVQLLPGLIVNPDTLLYTEFYQAYDGLEVKIYPDGDEDVIIDNINLTEYDVFYWYAEPVVDFPYTLHADDSLILTVFIGIVTDLPLGFVQDTMFIDCEAGDHEVLIIVDEDIISNIDEKDNIAVISGIFPNPFDQRANIMIRMPDDQQAIIYVLDNRGSMVSTLADKQFTAGDHHISWDGRNDNGSDCPPGIYYLVVKTDNGQSTGKIIKR